MLSIIAMSVDLNDQTSIIDIFVIHHTNQLNTSIANFGLVGPVTNVTLAPAFAAASAIENPILPEE